MATASVEFEKLVERILSLIGDKDDTLIRDYHIPDPDTGVSRQVDVLIERAGKKIFVECRDYARPQDVTWVETLMGRKISLGCDLIIGVSSSGFRQTALMKAEANGVILRSVGEVSDVEIISWGKSWRFDMELVCYSGLTLHLIGEKYIDRFVAENELLSFAGLKQLHASIFAVTAEISTRLTLNAPTPFSAEVFDDVSRPLFSRLGVKKSSLEGYGALLWQSFDLPANVELRSDGLEQNGGFAGAVYERSGIAMARYQNRSRLVLTLEGIRVPDHHSWTGKIKTRNSAEPGITEVMVVGTAFSPVNTSELSIKVTCPSPTLSKRYR